MTVTMTCNRQTQCTASSEDACTHRMQWVSDVGTCVCVGDDLEERLAEVLEEAELRLGDRRGRPVHKRRHRQALGALEAALMEELAEDTLHPVKVDAGAVGSRAEVCGMHEVSHKEGEVALLAGEHQTCNGYVMDT